MNIKVRFRIFNLIIKRFYANSESYYFLNVKLLFIGKKVVRCFEESPWRKSLNSFLGKNSEDFLGLLGADAYFFNRKQKNIGGGALGLLSG